MQAYAIGNLPLVKLLKNPNKWIQAWYADDGACLASFDNIKEWINILAKEGPRFGYYNQISKNILIVAPEFVQKAQTDFGGLELKIVTGFKYLGGFVGTPEDRDQWIQTKVEFWTKSVNKISEVGRKDPQAAFIAISKSLQNEWNYIQRVVEDTDESFKKLKDALCNQFLPEICGFEIEEFDAELMLRPSKFGGIGIRDPVKTAEIAYKTSLQSSEILKNGIISGTSLDILNHVQHFKKY